MGYGELKGGVWGVKGWGMGDKGWVWGVKGRGMGN